MQTLADFWPLAGFLVEPQPTDQKAWDKVMGEGSAESAWPPRGRRWPRRAVRPRRVEAALRGSSSSLGVKPKQVFQPIRVAISGSTISPGIFESVAALGREETLARVDAALARLSRRA